MKNWLIFRWDRWVLWRWHYSAERLRLRFDGHATREKLRLENENLRDAIVEMGSLAGEWSVAGEPFDPLATCLKIEEIAAKTTKEI